MIAFIPHQQLNSFKTELVTDRDVDAAQEIQTKLLVARGRFEVGLLVSRRQVSPSSGIQSHLVAFRSGAIAMPDPSVKLFDRYTTGLRKLLKKAVAVKTLTFEAALVAKSSRGGVSV